MPSSGGPLFFLINYFYHYSGIPGPILYSQTQARGNLGGCSLDSNTSNTSSSKMKSLGLGTISRWEHTAQHLQQRRPWKRDKVSPSFVCLVSRVSGDSPTWFSSLRMIFRKPLVTSRTINSLPDLSSAKPNTGKLCNQCQTRSAASQAPPGVCSASAACALGFCRSGKQWSVAGFACCGLQENASHPSFTVGVGLKYSTERRR